MTSSRFRTIGFDLDGTIADTAPDLMAALNHTLQSFGRNPLPLDRVRGMIGHGTRALLRNGLAATGTADEAEVAAGYPLLMAYYEAHVCDFTHPYPGVEAALDALAALVPSMSVRRSEASERPWKRLTGRRMSSGSGFVAAVIGKAEIRGRYSPATYWVSWPM